MNYKQLKYYLFIFFIFATQVVLSEVTFNYNTVTICEGDSYDLRNFQDNEAVVDVGWEIVGWRNTTNITVIPTVSPTVYTLEYLDKTNPTVIYTKDLTLSLRPKPSIDITPDGVLVTCVGSSVTLQKTASDYDNFYWQHVETGTKYYSEDIAFSATTGRTTYIAIATNNNCAALAQDKVVIEAEDAADSPIESIGLAAFSNSSHSTYGIGHVISYCMPEPLSKYVKPLGISIYSDMDKTFIYGYSLDNDVENDLYKITRCEVKWDTEDIYTQGADFDGQSYFNTFTVETDVYYKGCDITRTFTEKHYLQLSKNCSVGLYTGYTCNQFLGEGNFQIYYSGISAYDILDVQFVNKTKPNEYIPTKEFQVIYSVLFDAQTPPVMEYDATITYRDLDNSIKTLTESITAYTCQKEMIIDYGVIDNPSGHGSLSTFEGCHTQTCSNKNSNPANIIEYTICQDEPAYIALWTQIGRPLEIVWDNAELPIVWDPFFYNEDTDTYGQEFPDAQYALVNGKHTYSIALSDEWNIAAYFKVSPQDTTLYTGTLFGVPFAIRINVVNHHIVELDPPTTICKGQSIDLKTLERTNMADGSISWSVANTVVAPTIDTRYLAYGISKHKCQSQADYSITDEVLIKVDSPIWATTNNYLGNAGDQVSLSGLLNTNATNIQWFDENNNPVNSTITARVGTKTYTGVLENACGTESRQVTVTANALCSNVQTNLTDTICHYQLYNNQGFILPSQAIIGNFTHQLDLATHDGCDSTVVLTLTVGPINQETLYDTTYINNSYIQNGFNLPIQNTLGDFTQFLSLTNKYHCDSVVTLYLHVIDIVPPPVCSDKKTFLIDAICQDNNYSKNGFNLPLQSMDGVFMHQLDLATHDGCDSTVVLTLTVNSHKETLLNDTIYLNQPYIKNGFNLPAQFSVGNFTQIQNFQTVNGCDSTATLHLYVKEYQPISPTSPCDVQLTTIIEPSSTKNNLFGVINFTNNMPLIDCLGNYTITIFNRYGQKITTTGTEGWNGIVKGKVADAGVYYYVLEYTSGNKKKQLKGSIEIIKK